MIVEVYDSITVHEDFIWLTLGQIKSALKMDNIVNMDSRSVLATIPFINIDYVPDHYNESPFYLDFLKDCAAQAKEIFESVICTDNSFLSFDQVLSWITAMRTKY